MIFVFDKTKRETFNSIDEWVLEVNQYSTDKAVKVLVGNKADADIVIGDEEGKAKAVKLGYEFFNVSAKSGAGVNELFNWITRSLVEKNKHLNIVSLNDGVKLSEGQGGKKGWCC